MRQTYEPEPMHPRMPLDPVADAVLDAVASLGKVDRDRVLKVLDTMRAVVAMQRPGPIDAGYVFGEAMQAASGLRT